MNQGGTGQISEGMTVYDAAGQKIGKVREYNAQGGYLDVEKGFLFHKDFYVPSNAVARSDADGVYLQLSQDDLSGGTYDQPPTAGMAAGGTTDTVTQSTTTRSTPQNYQTAQTQTAPAGATTDETDLRVPVYEEELVAGKRQEELGRVHVHKEVVSEQETVPVTLQREEVTIERVPMQGQQIDPATTTDAFQGADINVPVMGEEAVVGKRAEEVEEVRLHKDVMTEQQQVSDTVRKERVVVDQVDETDQGNTPRR